jgi:SH2 domain
MLRSRSRAKQASLNSQEKKTKKNKIAMKRNRDASDCAAEKKQRTTGTLLGDNDESLLMMPFGETPSPPLLCASSNNCRHLMSSDDSDDLLLSLLDTDTLSTASSSSDSAQRGGKNDHDLLDQFFNDNFLLSAERDSDSSTLPTATASSSSTLTTSTSTNSSSFSIVQPKKYEIDALERDVEQSASDSHTLLTRIDLMLKEYQNRWRSLLLGATELVDIDMSLARRLDLAEARVRGVPKLVVVEQPFPVAVLKSSPLSRACVVQLLCAPQCSGIVVRARAVAVDEQGNESDADVRLDVNGGAAEVRVDAASGQARFERLSFQSTARQQLLCVRFDVAELGLSARSEPTMVMSRVSAQWLGAEQRLLMRQLFGSGGAGAQLTWPHFVNTLQVHMFRVCDSTMRPLCVAELDYLRTLANVGGERMALGVADVERLWTQFFGPSYQLMRDTRKNLPLWLNGFVCGFVSRDQAERMLSSHDAKTFLVRFSANNGGRPCLAFVKSDRTIGHFLLQPADTEQKLADFLAPHSRLGAALQMTIDRDTLEARTAPIAKRQLVIDFASKAKRDLLDNNQQDQGYPDRL